MAQLKANGGEWSSGPEVAWLTSSPVVRLAAVPSGRGGPAGVFALKYRDGRRLLYLGRSNTAADEAKKTNHKQADGITGRLRGATRQPPVCIQRALERGFPDDWQSAVGADAQKRASWLLREYRSCQWTETDTGPQAQDLFRSTLAHLEAIGQKPLAN